MDIRLNLSNAFNQQISAVNGVDNPQDAALGYASVGIAVLPKRKGRKDSALDGWQHINCTDPAQIRRWYGSNLYDGLILKPSVVTLDDGQQTNLIFLDCDGQAVYGAVCNQFPILRNTRTELTGSGNGYRILLLTDKLPTSGKGKITRKGILGTKHLGLEIYFKTGAVVVSPSIHPETHQQYKLINAAPVLHVDSIDDLAEWAMSLPAKNDKKKREHTRPVSVGQGDVPTDVSAAIARVLGIEGFSAEGWSEALACIFHPHEHDPERPAAAWNGQKNFFFCHKCGQSWNAKETAAKLGIDWPTPPRPNRSEKRYAMEFANRQNERTPSPVSNILSFEPLPPARQPHPLVDEVNRWGVGNWAGGVPDSIRSAALNYLPKGAAIALEILNRAGVDGLLDLTHFTREQVDNAAKVLGYCIPSTTLFRYLSALDGVFISVLGIESSVLNTIPKNGINSKSAGRRAVSYALVPQEEQVKAIESHAYPRFIERFHPTDGDSIIATMYESVVDALDTTEDKSALALELAAVIDASASTQDTRKAKAGVYARKAYERFQKSLNDPHSSTLPEGWEIANESDYIMSFAHAIGNGRAGERVSLREWSQLLGISVNSVPTYIQRAGLGKLDQPQYEYMNIDIAENTVKEVNAKAKSLKAYPRWIVVRDEYDNEITSVAYDPATAPKIAKQYRVLGCKVEVKMQAANAYQVVSESPVEVQKRAIQSVSSADPVITPLEPEFEVVRPFREPRLNPAWVAGQFRLVLQQRGRWVEKWRFIDQYGEIIETKEPRALAELIINRPIASSFTRQRIESEMTAGGWRKVSG